MGGEDRRSIGLHGRVPIETTARPSGCFMDTAYVFSFWFRISIEGWYRQVHLSPDIPQTLLNSLRALSWSLRVRKR